MLDELFNPEAEAKQAPAETQEHVTTEDEGTVEAPETEQGEPTTPESAEKHVPLAALEAERGQRKDWKEKALRFEGEVKAMRDQLARQQQQPQEYQEQRQVDPVQQIRNEMFNTRLDFSERMARKEYGSDAVDQAYEKFAQAVEKNPALYQQVMNSADPWDAVVLESKKLSMLDEIGTDPIAYRAKVEAEIRASLQLPATAAAVNLPQSLAGVRSAAARSAPTQNGPAPLSSLFKN